MNWQLLIPLLTTTGVAILGWCVGHALNAHRDRNNKRREVRVQYLIEAYRSLEAAACRDRVYNTKLGRGFESAIADIQLFGTSEQARIVRTMAVAIDKRQNDASMRQVLMSLRDALRKELGLGVLNEEPFHFRLRPEGQPGAAPNGGPAKPSGSSGVTGGPPPVR